MPEGRRSGVENKYGSIPKDPYAALGVSPNSTKDQIKKAYRRLSQKYHPDTHRGDEEAAEWFRVITEAKDILTKPGRQSRSDHYFKGWTPPAGGTYRPGHTSTEQAERQRQENARRQREAEEAFRREAARVQREAEERNRREEARRGQGAAAKAESERRQREAQEARRAREERARQEAEARAREAEEERTRNERARQEQEAERESERQAFWEEQRRRAEADVRGETYRQAQNEPPEEDPMRGFRRERRIPKWLRNVAAAIGLVAATGYVAKETSEWLKGKEVKISGPKEPGPARSQNATPQKAPQESPPKVTAPSPRENTPPPKVQNAPEEKTRESESSTLTSAVEEDKIENNTVPAEEAEVKKDAPQVAEKEPPKELVSEVKPEPPSAEELKERVERLMQKVKDREEGTRNDAPGHSYRSRDFAYRPPDFDEYGRRLIYNQDRTRILARVLPNGRVIPE